MFEEFDRSKSPQEGRGRMGLSFLISVGIFVGVAAALAAAIATVQVVVKRKQREVDVTFADLPPRPPKPKPVVKRAAPGGPRKAVARAALKPPTEIPQVQPEEAEGDLAAAGDVGPVEGFTDGTAGGSGGGPAVPAQETEAVIEPRYLSGCQQPEIPEGLHSTAATIEIDVRMLIDARGRVQTAAVLRSHPLVPDDLVLACARAQLFAPAHLPDGTTVPSPYRLRFTFKPAGV